MGTVFKKVPSSSHEDGVKHGHSSEQNVGGEGQKLILLCLFCNICYLCVTLFGSLSSLTFDLTYFHPSGYLVKKKKVLFSLVKDTLHYYQKFADFLGLN